MGSLVRVSVLSGFSEFVEQLGGGGEAFLAEFGMPCDISPADSRLVSFVEVARLLETAARRLDRPDLGLCLASRQGVDRLGGIGVVACNAATPRQALLSVRRFLSLHSSSLSMQLEPLSEGEVLRIVFDWQDPALNSYRQIREQVLGNTLTMIRMLVETECCPQNVLLPHGPQMAEGDYCNFFGCEVLFSSGYCAMDFPAAFLDTPLKSADPVVERLAIHHLEQQSATLPVPLTVEIRQLLSEILPSGRSQLGNVAGALKLHPRTLQRRLAAEGLRFEELLDNVRRDLATRYLSDPNLALGQITGLLGYSEQSTFQRACRRWFAETPRNHRLRLAGSAIVGRPESP
ncbi:AraC family transcriptional regulator ligand-binding domain-containing protein [Microbulbifer sp. TRSA007]|uniref:AraC family transcriptional regulator ligand-binding domain-containing protein n=1 Tax=Microbulbifer sp. TRSA007 TaxID=3243384 RepID=UPI0040390999